MEGRTVQIAEAMAGGHHLIQPSRWSEPPTPPSARTVGIIGKLGLRYPPANSVDREAHAARVALLAEDCADIDPALLDEAARDWAKRSPFFPRACELRDNALAIGRMRTQGRALPAPRAEVPPPPEQPPLTDDEIATMPGFLVRLGIKMGEIDAERAARLRDSDGSPEGGNTEE